jgi:pimeloyl-ACP methyl ester carboxylesterase
LECKRQTSLRRLHVPLGASGALILLLAGCATPISVERSEPIEVRRELTSNVISDGSLSEATRITLHRENLSGRFETDPDGTIATLHAAVLTGWSTPDTLFALAEMAFHRAQQTGSHAYFLAAAVYAYEFLFPDDPGQRPSGFDTRFRTASDIYNRSLAAAFASPDGSRVTLGSGRFKLPFGSIDIAFDRSRVRWGGQALSDFTSTDALRIEGLNIRYWRAGIGAPLAADVTPQVQEAGFQIEPEVKVPVTALLRIEGTLRDLVQGHLRGTMEVYPAFEPNSVTIAGQSVPLEVDTTAAFAFSFANPKLWESEFAGFLDGNFFDRSAAQLVALEPYRADQIPVVFIHGTGSSSGRWANLINDLQSDPVIREHFQFWSFSYASGNPVAYSAERLRGEIEDAVQRLDPSGQDAVLRQMVLIGHSQGGLLAKWLVIDSGSRLWDALSEKPPEELRLSAESKTLLRRVYFVKPLPEVRRVIFIATPQHGSFVADNPIAQLAARLITPGARVLRALRDLADDNPDDLRLRLGPARLGSVWGMSPSNPLLKAFAQIPVSPNVVAHSIIAVEGDGPVETGDDGVVSYRSAHIPEAASELVVRSGHSVQSDPRTVNEVRRILLLHLAEFCRQGCTPAANRGSQRVSAR